MTKAKTPSVDELSDLTIDDAKPHLAELSPEQLQLLRAKEVEKGEDKQRSTLLHLIDTELGKRDDADDAPDEADPQAAPAAAATETIVAGDNAPPPEQPAPAGLTGAADPAADGLTFDSASEWQRLALSLKAVCDEIGGGLGGAAFEQPGGLRGDTVNYEALPALVAMHMEAARGQADELRTATARIVELEQEKAIGVPVDGSPAANALHVANVAGPSELSLRFLEGDKYVDMAVPLPVSPIDFHQRSADTVIYDRQIDFAVTTPRFVLTAVALVDGDGVVIDTCQIVPRMEVGGGRSVILPAGTLIFRQPRVTAERLS